MKVVSCSCCPLLGLIGVARLLHIVSYPYAVGSNAVNKQL